MAIKQGEVFLHDFGPPKSHVQAGPRPALVVQTDALNQMSGYSNVIIVPLTTKGKPAATYVQIEPSAENDLSQTSWAITNQIFTVDRGGLGPSMGVITKEELYAVKAGLKVALSIS